MPKVSFSVPQISCHHCVNTIKRELGGIEGVRSVEGDVKTKRVEVVYEQPATVDKLKETLKEIGYPGTEV